MLPEKAFWINLSRKILLGSSFVCVCIIYWRLINHLTTIQVFEERFDFGLDSLSHRLSIFLGDTQKSVT